MVHDMRSQTLTALHPTPKAAEIIGVSESFLVNDRCTGRHRIPYIKLGRKVVYREDDLLNWLESRRHCAGEAA